MYEHVILLFDENHLISQIIFIWDVKKMFEKMCFNNV